MWGKKFLHANDESIAFDEEKNKYTVMCFAERTALSDIIEEKRVVDASIGE
jgi:hypothetical protein